MASKFLDLLKKHKLVTIPADATPELLSEIEREFEEAEKLLVKTQTPATNQQAKKPDEGGAIDMNAFAELLQAKINEAVKPINDQIASVRTYTQTQEQNATAQAAAAVTKRYQDHVEKLFVDGRINKAERDKRMNLDDAKVKSIIGNETALDVYIETTGALPVDPAFKAKSAPAAAAATDQERQKTPVPGEVTREARDRMAQELVEAQ